MGKILVRGSKQLEGTVSINGSKNATLPIMAASLLCDGQVILKNVPNIRDVSMMAHLLDSVGAKTNFRHYKSCSHGHTLVIDPMQNSCNFTPDEEISCMIRASILLLAPIVSKCKHAVLRYPGGCKIGSRPIDMHIDAMMALGTSFNLFDTKIAAEAQKLHGTTISFAKVSVGATETAILASVLAEGLTLINNAAVEPEVCDLISFLVKCGAEIHGIGTRILTIKGVKSLTGCTHTIIPDRVEAGTYILATIMTRGNLQINGIQLKEISCISNMIKSAGGVIIPKENGLLIKSNGIEIKPTNVKTNHYPNFPTDMQAPFMSAMCLANGTSTIEEGIFENRFLHVAELQKMGADIEIEGNKAIIRGVSKLCGAKVCATDLRASAALLLAALAAEEETVIENISILRRGYESMEKKLAHCGAEIQSIT